MFDTNKEVASIVFGGAAIIISTVITMIWPEISYVASVIWFGIAAFLGVLGLAIYLWKGNLPFVARKSTLPEINEDCLSQSVVISATRHVAYDGSNRICLGFKVYPIKDCYDVNIKAAICEKNSNWQFHEEECFSGDLYEGGENEQFYPGNVQIENGDIKYSTGAGKDKALIDKEALVFILTLTKRGMPPARWEFEVSKNSSYAAIIDIRTNFDDEIILWANQ